MQTDVAIIGGGPAGLSAATVLASYGAKVVVVDEQAHIGGRLLGQLYQRRNGTWWIGRHIAHDLEQKATNSSVQFLTETSVWGVFPQWTLQLYSPSRVVPETIQASCVLICTGAAQVPIPIAGWTLPGVMGVGAAQMLMNAYHVRPGKRALIIGVDLLGLTIARELQLGGVDIAGIVLPNKSLISRTGDSPLAAMRFLGQLSDWAPTWMMRRIAHGLRHPFWASLAAKLFPHRGIKIWDMPFLFRQAATAILGEQEVEGVMVVDVQTNGDPIPGSEHAMAVDTVFLSGGLYPLAELPAAMGCRLAFIPELGGQVPLYGPWGETTLESVFVAGSVTGIEGAQVAMEQGILAGIGIARQLGLIDQDDAEAQRQKAHEKIRLARSRAEVQFLASIQIGRNLMKTLWQNAMVATTVSDT